MTEPPRHAQSRSAFPCVYRQLCCGQMSMDVLGRVCGGVRPLHPDDTGWFNPCSFFSPPTNLASSMFGKGEGIQDTPGTKPVLERRKRACTKHGLDK
ncbi:hypothetical protein CEXT_37581 [Caerostris extrusa]|uniref:Uncharacterized protein n=1 Tax=Caerostris extrusa TaxID=172846 RepID=A0AAV4UDY2_CAEEX|nr:hypothetical protein CEXT_37581 [Caerostris extrusa]